MNLRLVAVAVIATALAACASRPVSEPITVESPPSATPSAPAGEVRHCVSGTGVVVRLTQNATTSSGQPASKSNGVLDSVLNGPSSASQTPAGSGSSPANGSGSSHGTAAGGHDIYVRMDDGQRIILNQRDLGAIVQGSHVVVENCRARVAH